MVDGITRWNGISTFGFPFPEPVSSPFYLRIQLCPQRPLTMQQRCLGWLTIQQAQIILLDVGKAVED